MKDEGLVCCIGKGKKSKKVVITEDYSDSDDAIIDEFLPSMNQTAVVATLTSALNAEPPSDEEFEPGRASLGRLTPTLNQSRDPSPSDDGTVYCA